MSQLIRETISHDALTCAEALVEGIKAGHVNGCVIGMIYPRRRYSVHVCGSAGNDPTFARGVTGAIEDELRDMIHERGDFSPTV